LIVNKLNKYIQMKRMAPRLLKDCEIKASTLKACNINYPIGPEMTVTDYLQKVEKYRSLVDNYNHFLTEAELVRSSIRRHEKEMRDVNERVRSAIIIYNGKTSSEYKAFIKATKPRKKPKPI
jgi:hypothetical protein